VKRLALIVTLAIIASFMMIPSAFATMTNTTHLNNIPITDTLKTGTMEWDLIGAYSEHDSTRGRQVSSRLFVALFDNVEIGMAWNISRHTRGIGPVEMAAKWTVLDQSNGFPVSIAVGAEGITGNYQRTGIDPTYYAVVGIQDVHIIGWWDWYVGIANNPVGVDNEDNSVFGGFKYFISDDVQLNADYKGFQDNGESVMSAGLNYDWVNHIGFQGWVERDSVAEENTYVLQLAVRGDMKDLKAEVSDPE
jgi:hypothetical protein